MSILTLTFFPVILISKTDRAITITRAELIPTFTPLDWRRNTQKLMNLDPISRRLFSRDDLYTNKPTFYLYYKSMLSRSDPGVECHYTDIHCMWITDNSIAFDGNACGSKTKFPACELYLEKTVVLLRILQIINNNNNIRSINCCGKYKKLY